LARIASGGSPTPRHRGVLVDAETHLVFDEIDAGIGAQRDPAAGPVVLAPPPGPSA
jgi:hypothetical protein